VVIATLRAMPKRFSRPNGVVILIAIVDAGPLYASVDEDDENFDRSRLVLRRLDLHLVIPALVVAEETYLVGRRLGRRVEATFLRTLAEFDVEAPSVGDWLRMGELVDQYSNFLLGGTDASVIALADCLGTDLLVTLDYRHFAAVRPRHCQAFQLLPS
jgi:predicted nucleic acid-binding protein